MSLVKSTTPYSFQSYLEAVTGEVYFRKGTNDIEMIEEILELKGLNLWNYPLNEIDHIVENQINVVLVDCYNINSLNQIEQELRWFEVPEDFKEES